MKRDFSVMLLLSLKLLQCHGLSEILRSTTKTRKSIQPIYKCQIAEVENRIRCYDLFFFFTHYYVPRITWHGCVLLNITRMEHLTVLAQIDI